MTQGHTADFIANTYAERGVAVPFTTPRLSQARLRLSRRGEAEFILTPPGGALVPEVLPWRGLSGGTAVTLHDRMLMDEILARSARTPESVRAAALRVAATGVAGDGVATAALASLTADRAAYIATGTLLVASLRAAMGLPPEFEMLLATTAKPRSATADAWGSALAPVLNGTAKAGKAGLDALLGQVEGLAALLAPVGVGVGTAAAAGAGPGRGEDGRLRRLVADLDALQSGLLVWAGLETQEVARLAAWMAGAAAVALAHARLRLGRIDQHLSDLRPLLGKVAPWRAALVADVAGLDLALDGWPYLIGLWQRAADQPLSEQRMTVAEMFRLLPTIPEGEGGASADPLDRDTLARIRIVWARSQPDEGAGQVDIDAVKGVEALKAGMA